MRKLALAVLLLLVVSHAENYVAINSYDGRDVLSGIFYANVKGYDVKFMPSQGEDAQTLAIKVGEGHDILLIQSDERPISSMLKMYLEKQNNTVNVYTSYDGGDTNLDLAIRSGTKKFIIVESAFSDGALSALPYASLKNAYIILANEENAEDVREIVRGADEIIIYSYVDSAVSTALQEFNPEVIGKGEDRYEDNVLIAERMMEEYPEINSIIMTEGTFIEEGMADGEIPIVFSGRVVPTVTYNFIKQKTANDELDVVYLLGGTQITNAVRNMRDQIKSELKIDQAFGIWMRFAQFIPGETGMMTLDLFYLPAYIPELEITEVVYNTATEKMMISVDNAGMGPAYYVTEIHILVDGEEYKTFGDDEPKLIEYGDTAGIEYVFDPSEIEEGAVTAVVIVKYGSSKYVLEEYDDYVGSLLEIDYADQSSVSAREARYDTSKEIIYLTLKNNKGEIAYVSPDMEIILDGEKTTLQGPNNEPVNGNSIITVEFPIGLGSEDLAANDEVTVHLKYGGRPGFLGKESTEVLPLQKEGVDFLLILLILLAILIIILAGYLIWKKKGGK